MQVSNINNAYKVNFKSNTNLDKNVSTTKTETKADSFEAKSTSTMTKEQKQELLKDSKSNAAGWAILGGWISSAYFGLRSDETVAKKYDLDPQKDKELIKEIKNQQVISTIPGVVGNFLCMTNPLIGIGVAVGGWAFEKFRNPEKIDV
ncbi:MAG: hypothetical protein IJB79_02695 [Candidatus Gastranaerophilales bacterium]|nr:hypothetical protein [Candidatus Gastranaerophilales bacterium]